MEQDDTTTAKSSFFGRDRYGARLTAQAPLSPLEVRRTRALALLYPVVAALAVLMLGVSVVRVVEVSLFFLLWVGMQLLVLSPARRRQVIGLPAQETTTTTKES